MFAESMRIMSTDYKGTNFDYYIDKSTGKTIELPSKIKSKLIAYLKENIEGSVKSLKEFLIKNEIESYERYQNNSLKIQMFVEALVKKQANSIQNLYNELE